MPWKIFHYGEYNTFGLDYKADKLVSVRSEEEASQMVRNGDFARGENLIIGGGSNLLFISDFHGTIIHPEIDGHIFRGPG